MDPLTIKLLVIVFAIGVWACMYALWLESEVERLRKKEADPWIKVTDRLPEPGTDVIVHNGFLGVATYRHPHHRDEWWDAVAGGPWSLVTHWMPTPEDPR